MGQDVPLPNKAGEGNWNAMPGIVAFELPQNEIHGTSRWLHVLRSCGKAGAVV